MTNYLGKLYCNFSVSTANQVLPSRQMVLNPVSESPGNVLENSDTLCLFPEVLI